MLGGNLVCCLFHSKYFICVVFFSVYIVNRSPAPILLHFLVKNIFCNLLLTLRHLLTVFTTYFEALKRLIHIQCTLLVSWHSLQTRDLTFRKDINIWKHQLYLVCCLHVSKEVVSTVLWYSYDLAFYPLNTAKFFYIMAKNVISTLPRSKHQSYVFFTFVNRKYIHFPVFVC